MAPEPGLSPLEIEGIDLFISFLRLLGMPKSIGELYGVLFVASEPLSMEELMAKLQMSKGAASQGLKLLRSFGAVKSVYQPGDRRDHFCADFELSRFGTAFIEGELEPRFEHAASRLTRMQNYLEELPEAKRAEANARLDRLRHWQVKGQEMLPLIKKLLVA